jgi:hypothetical protein
MTRREVVAAATAIALGPGALQAMAIDEIELTDPIVELRDYRLVPGKRETLIELFDRVFIDSHEAIGARIVGMFRDRDAADRFIWLRSFKDMPARAAALQTFYGGPVWHEYAKAANATMIDSDDVYLLQQMGDRVRLPRFRPPRSEDTAPGALFVVDIYPAEHLSRDTFMERARHAPHVITMLESVRAENNYPPLPVHSEWVWVAIRRFPEVATVPPIADLPSPARTLRLQATSRSLLR